MAWIYFQESVELESHSNRGLELSLIVSKTDTHKASYCRECNRVILIPRQFGMMCDHSQKIYCHQLTLFSADSHVRTSVLLELEKVWAASEADYSSKLSDLQKKLSLRLYSSKTCRPLELEAFERLSEHLPKSGMTVGGLVYLPQALELHTKENDGSYLPTPTAQSYGSNQGGSAGRTGKKRLSLVSMASKNLWPTPQARDYRSGDNPNSDRAKRKQKLGWSKNLNDAVLLPTPYARDWKGTGAPSEYDRNTPPLSAHAGGQLNPTWVEWLMGYPIGWTELSALVTQLFRTKSKQPLKS